MSAGVAAHLVDLPAAPVTALEALQTTLAGEHAALYVYGALGGRTSASTAPALSAALREGYAVHRAQRDQLTRTIRDLGAEPVAAAPALRPARAARLRDRRRSGRRRTWSSGAPRRTPPWSPQTVGDERRWAIGALTGAAVRRLALGAAPEAFPGAGELRPVVSRPGRP